MALPRQTYKILVHNFTKRLTTFFFLLIFVTISAYGACATIQVIDSIAEVREELYNATENVLFVFDIDETFAPLNDIFYIRFRDINDFDISVIDFVNQLRSKLAVLNHNTNDPYFLEKITSAAFAASKFCTYRRNNR